MLKSIVTGVILLLLPFVSISQIYMEMAMDSSMTYEAIVEEAERFFDKMGKGSHTGYKSFKRWEYWMKRCLDSNGKMIGGAMVDDRYQQFMATQSEFQPALTSTSWAPHGPVQARTTSGWSSHIGRVTSMAIDSKNMDHIIVGTPSGGIWKTLDGGQSWNPISDKESVLKIYSLEISPHDSNHYYAGTWGGGIIQSTDGGENWFGSNGIFGNARIIAVRVSEDNPQHIMAINEGGNIFKSFNGGAFWNNRLSSSTTLYDIEYKPDDPNVIYVSGQGRVYISHDAGTSFSELPGPWTQSGLLFNPIMLAVTEQDPEYLYVLEADNGGFGAVYLSVDGGASFETRSHNFQGGNNILGYVKGVRGGQAPRDMDIAVNPENKNEVHVGGIMSYRSVDSGSTWVQTSHWLRSDPLPFIHADIDMILYEKGRVFFCTDGGLFTSDNSAITFTDRTTGLNIRQFYRLDVEPDSTGKHIIVAGSQDNGVGKFVESEGWLDFIGADGMEPIIEKSNTDIIFGTTQYGNIYKTITGGERLSGGVRQSPGVGAFVTPLQKDPFEPLTMYQGKQQMYKSTDGSATWSKISDFQMTYPKDTFMQEIAVAPLDGDVIIAGFEKQIFRTENGGSTWTDVTPSISLLNVNYIHVHPNDPKRFSVCISGNGERVWETRDGGVSWVSLHSNLPDIATECVIYEAGPNDGMYVSMDVGIYYRDKNMSEWMIITDELPNVKVTELEIQDCTLYACTYGRGLWSTGLLDQSEMYADLDGDGYGDSNTGVVYCLAPEGYVSEGGDCNDEDSTIHPNAPEVCDGIDNDCDGQIETGMAIQFYYLDADGDGYGDASDSYEGCEQVQGYVTNADDCNDADQTVHPDAQEICDGIDNNCDGTIDEGLLQTRYYADADGDGYGDASNSYEGCEQVQGYVTNADDCNDSDQTVHPNAQEICDDIDNNCDGTVDEGFVQVRYYVDADGDGYGEASDSYVGCVQRPGYVLNRDDCDDEDSSINPDAQEVCDGIDNNCNSAVDEGLPQIRYYADVDNDGYGDEDNSYEGCEQFQGYVMVSGDCDDNDSSISPEAEEACDLIDNNCNGTIDEGCEVEYEDCDGNYLVIRFITQSQYHANTQISSNAKVSNAQIFKSGEEIILLPDFEVVSGAEFQAIIEPCTFGAQSPLTDNIKEFVFLKEAIQNYFDTDKEVVFYIQNEDGNRIIDSEGRIEDLEIIEGLRNLQAGEYKLTTMQGDLLFESGFSVNPYRKANGKTLRE